MAVIFLSIHLSLTSVFIYKYTKEPEQVNLNNDQKNKIKNSLNNDMEKSTSQLTDISTITSETL